MTDSEEKNFIIWHRATADLVKEIIESIDNKGDRWTNGYDRGWARGLISGLQRMRFSVELGSATYPECRQTEDELLRLYERKTGVK